MKYLKSRISWRIPQTNYKKISKTKSHSSFVGNIWGAHFADMYLASKFNKGICFLLCVIDIFSKYGVSL